MVSTRSQLKRRLAMVRDPAQRPCTRLMFGCTDCVLDATAGMYAHSMTDIAF